MAALTLRFTALGRSATILGPFDRVRVTDHTIFARDAEGERRVGHLGVDDWWYAERSGERYSEIVVEVTP